MARISASLSAGSTSFAAFVIDGKCAEADAADKDDELRRKAMACGAVRSRAKRRKEIACENGCSHCELSKEYRPRGVADSAMSSARISCRRNDAVCAAFALFALGVLVGRGTGHPCVPPSPPMERSAFEERGPPTKQELGQSGWTLLHTMAANFPDSPTREQEERASTFLRALGHLYPCKTCAGHFRQHYEQYPIIASSRAELSM